MVNPLSRVAMKSILEKNDTVKGYNNNLSPNKKVKTLSDFGKNKEQASTSRSGNSYNMDSSNLVVDRKAKTLGDFTKDRNQASTSTRTNSYNKDNYSNNNFNTKSTRNIDIKPDVKINNLIKDLIHREVKIKANNSIDSAITLEQAAAKTKQ